MDGGGEGREGMSPKFPRYMQAIRCISEFGVILEREPSFVGLLKYIYIYTHT